MDPWVGQWWTSGPQLVTVYLSALASGWGCPDPCVRWLWKAEEQVRWNGHPGLGTEQVFFQPPNPSTVWGRGAALPGYREPYLCRPQIPSRETDPQGQGKRKRLSDRETCVRGTGQESGVHLLPPATLATPGAPWAGEPALLPPRTGSSSIPATLPSAFYLCFLFEEARNYETMETSGCFPCGCIFQISSLQCVTGQRQQAPVHATHFKHSCCGSQSCSAHPVTSEDGREWVTDATVPSPASSIFPPVTCKAPPSQGGEDPMYTVTHASFGDAGLSFSVCMSVAGLGGGGVPVCSMTLDITNTNHSQVVDGLTVSQSPKIKVADSTNSPISNIPSD